MDHNITITIDAEPCTYYGIETELQQIILNITNNAKDNRAICHGFLLHLKLVYLYSSI